MSDRKNSSRAERVRKRRSSAPEPKAPKVQARRKKAVSRTYSQELPPLTARGVVNDFAIERRKKAHRRRFNAILSMPNLQERSLSLPKVRFGSRVVSFSLALLLGVSLYLAWSLPTFRVSAATVTGNQFIPANEVIDMLGIRGQSIFLLVPSQVERRTILEHYELASVSVSIALPNQVTIHVTERQPYIRWQQDGTYTWIDESGIAFRPRGEAQATIMVQASTPPPAPLILSAEQTDPTPFMSPDMVEALKALAPIVPAGMPILYDQATGLGWSDPRGWRVEFGNDFKNIATQILVYQSMVDMLGQRGIQPVVVNVAHPSAPFYRVAQVEQ